MARQRDLFRGAAGRGAEGSHRHLESGVAINSIWGNRTHRGAIKIRRSQVLPLVLDSRSCGWVACPLCFLRGCPRPSRLRLRAPTLTLQHGKIHPTTRAHPRGSFGASRAGQPGAYTSRAWGSASRRRPGCHPSFGDPIGRATSKSCWMWPERCCEANLSRSSAPAEQENQRSCAYSPTRIQATGSPAGSCT